MLTQEGQSASLLEFIQMFRANALGATIIALICIGVALTYALTATPTYRAEIAVREAENDTPRLGGSLAGLGGLASLAGINLGSLGGGARDAIPVLKSRMLAEAFIRSEKLEAKILKGSPKVSLWLAVQAFRRRIVTVVEDKRTGVTTLSVAWRDPTEAASWANGLVKLANNVLSTRDKGNAERSLKFLNEQLSQTTVIEMRRSIYALIENEMKTLMLTDARSDYALVVVDPAVPPEQRYAPRRTLIVALGGVFGVVAGIAFVFGMAALRRVNLPQRASNHV